MMARSTTRSNQRPDTLMQDRKADRSMKTSCDARPDRTLGHERCFRDIRDESGLPPTPERLRQRSEPDVSSPQLLGWYRGRYYVVKKSRRLVMEETETVSLNRCRRTPECSSRNNRSSSFTARVGSSFRSSHAPRVK